MKSKNIFIDIVYSDMCGWGFIVYEEDYKDNEGFKVYNVVNGESGYNWTKDQAAKNAAKYLEENIDNENPNR